MTDAVLILAGLVAQVERNTPIEGRSAPEGGEWVALPAGEAVCGMEWDGEALSTPAPAPEVPDLVPMYKVRKYLIKQGLLAAVEAALEALPGEAGALARVDWQYAPNLVRASGLVQGLGATLNLTSEQIDAMCVAANALT